jgi:hypothetical protein
MPRIMEPFGRFEIEPQLFLPNSLVCFGCEGLSVPAGKPLVIELGGIARDDYAAGQLPQNAEEPNMVVFVIIVAIDAGTSASTWKVRRIAVNQLRSREVPRTEKIDCIRLNVGSKGGKAAPPASDDRSVEIDSDTLGGRFLVAKDGTSSQVRLNVSGVWRKQIDDVLVGLPLAAGISHGTIIVISGDDVKL